MTVAQDQVATAQDSITYHNLCKRGKTGNVKKLLSASKDHAGQSPFSPAQARLLIPHAVTSYRFDTTCGKFVARQQTLFYV